MKSQSRKVARSQSRDESMYLAMKRIDTSGSYKSQSRKVTRSQSHKVTKSMRQ